MRIGLLSVVFILLAFVPSAAPPTLPACTAAQHDAHKAKGPDGVSYATWHPQVDLTRGCIFDHEHGSNPALFEPMDKPLFGYSAAAMGMSEGNPGFKVYAFTHDGYKWLIVNHQGTANAVLAACTEHHTLDIAARRLSDNVLVASLHLMPSFGQGRINSTNAPIPRCAPTTSGGVRLLPSAADGNVGYEPWRVGHDNPPFLNYGDLTFNTLNPQTACDTVTCTVNVARTMVLPIGTVAANGAERFLKIENNNPFWLRATGIYSGTFAWGGAQQFIAPGTDIHLAPTECWAWDAGSYIYWCGADRRTQHDAQPFLRNPFIGGAN